MTIKKGRDKKESPRVKCSVQIKLLFFVIIIIVLIITVQYKISYFYALEHYKNDELQKLSALYTGFINETTILKQTVAALSYAIASRPDVKALAEKADQEGLSRLLKPVYEELQDKYNINHLHLYTPQGELYLRYFHLDKLNPQPLAGTTLFDAKASRGTSAGIEISEGRIGIQGISPLLLGKKLLGFVEISADYNDRFILGLKERNNADYSIWTYKVEPDDPLKPDSSLNDADFVLFTSTLTNPIQLDREVYIQVLRDNSPVFACSVQNKQHYSLLVAPLSGSKGNVLGFLKIIHSRDEGMAVLLQHQITGLLVELALAMSGIILLWLLVRIVVIRPLRHLSQTAQAQISGNLDRKVGILPNDEFGNLGRIFNTLSGDLNTTVRDYQGIIEELQNKEREILKLNRFLEKRVAQRTVDMQKANIELQRSIQQLHKTQEQLIQSEKMAVLGGLVAGITHEINTPMGIGVTASSHLTEKTREIGELYDRGDMTESEFKNYLKIADESAQIILANLKRAADHVRSFKQLAVDQASGERRRFNLKEYINEIFFSMHPKLKRTKHLTIVNCPENIIIDNYPSAFSQIITNLVINSLIHGFASVDEGVIKLDVQIVDTYIKLVYTDNGQGMDESIRENIFQPFFTTRREKGGSGLGLHIVYNLITEKLQGTITCSSVRDRGVEFLIKLPLILGEPASG